MYVSNRRFSALLLVFSIYRAVVVFYSLFSSAITLSFASLAVATNRGIRSLGMLVLVGLTTVTLFAFMMVPTGWMTAWKIRGELPRD